MCVEISYATKENGEITSLGGIDQFFGRDQPWGLRHVDIVRLVESGLWSFYVNRKTAWETQDRLPLYVERRNGKKYLRAAGDGERRNQPFLSERFLQRAANEPTIARRLGIFTNRRGPHPIDHLGPYTLLPARTIFVRFVAPFSYRYEVRVNGEQPLEEATAETTRLPDPLERSGWFALTHIGHLGAYDPAAAVQNDRDFTVYELRVRLPEELVDSDQVSLQLAQLSLNPNCRPPGLKSDALNLELRRLAA